MFNRFIDFVNGHELLADSSNTAGHDLSLGHDPKMRYIDYTDSPYNIEDFFLKINISIFH